MAEQGLILVRHAMSAVERGMPSREWGITREAQEDCRRLAERLPGSIVAIAASLEPKAQQTAAILGEHLGLAVTIDARLGEVERPTTWDEDYRALAATYLEGAELEGWEPCEQVRTRFAAAVDGLRRGAGQGQVVVVNHGLALSLYLAGLVAIDVVPFWRALRFPDAWVVDGNGRLEQVFADGPPAPDEVSAGESAGAQALRRRDS